MIPEELRAVLSRFPRLHGSGYPTPLEPLDRLTRQINGPRLWVKRDDGVGPGMGGNKGRKLEFLIADALSLNRSKVVTFGGLQSNHARMTAAMCAAHGLQAHLFFFERRPAELVGNLQLNELLAARMHFIPFGDGSSGSMTIEFTNRLVRIVSMLFTGPGAYFIPVGGHNVIGCLGYVAAALELHEQLATMGLDPGRVTLVTAVGTGGTLAGLLAGLRLLRSPVAIIGVDVGGLWKHSPDRRRVRRPRLRSAHGPMYQGHQDARQHRGNPGRSCLYGQGVCSFSGAGARKGRRRAIHFPPHRGSAGPLGVQRSTRGARLRRRKKECQAC